MKKTMVLLSILLFSFLTIIPTVLPVEAQVVSDPLEANGAVGRPYQDLTGVDVYSNGTHLSVNVTLDQGPPKIDNETHLNIYVAIDTQTGGVGFIGDYGVSAAFIDPNDYWDWCLALYSWTGLVSQSADLIYSNYTHYNAFAKGITVTNSSDGRVVITEIPLSAIGNPNNVTIGVITNEDNTYCFRDTIGNATAQYEYWGQYLAVDPFTFDLLTTAGSSASASDPIKDFVILPFNDITEVEIGYDDKSNIIVNVTFANVTSLDNSWNWAERWDISIAMDTDHLVNDANQSWMAYTQYDTKIDPAVNNTYWERCVVIDNPYATPADIHLYDEEFNDLGAMGITAALLEEEDKVIVSIPMAIIPFGSDRKLNMTIISGMDNDNTIYDVVGSYTYFYDSTVNTQGLFLITTSIPLTQVFLPPWPGPKVSTPPDVIGRPYQDIRRVSARSDGTNLYVDVTLEGAPPKQDNETHVNMYVAIDNSTIGGSWQFPDAIDAGYIDNASFWEYCLALYNWTTPGAQSFKLFRINEYVTPPRTPSWSEVDTAGISVTNSSAGTIVNITIPLTLIGSPSTVTLGVVTSEDFAKIKDTVGSGYVRASISQWVEIAPAITGLSTSIGSSSASDPVKDFVGKSFWDITGVTTAQKDKNIVVNVTFQEVACLSYSMDQWRLSIGIDTDHAAGSGQSWMAFIGYCDAQIDSAFNGTYWERCVVLDSITDIHLYDEDFNDLGAMGITAALLEEEDKVMVYIPQCVLPPSLDRSLNLTIVSGMDGGNTLYDVRGTYTYILAPATNTQGLYLVRTSIPPTGPVMYPFPVPGTSINNAMGRPYQDLTGVEVYSNGTYLSLNVTLNQAPPKQANETQLDIYVAFDTVPGGRDWFPDGIDARYDLSAPEHFWEYCLAVYRWTGLVTPLVDLVNKSWGHINALANSIGNMTITNSTDGKTLMMEIPLSLIGNPDNVTVGVVTSEDFAKIKDTIGNGITRLVCSQWMEVQPAIIDLPTGAGNSNSASDSSWDFVAKAFWDITGVEVSANVTDVIVDVAFNNVTGLSYSMDQWRLSIGIDTDHAAGSGQPWLGFLGYSDTRIDSAANGTYWEKCVVLDSLADIHIYFPNWTDIGSSGTRAALFEDKNKVRVAIPKYNLEFSADYNLTLTILSGTDQDGTVYDTAGTYNYTYDPEVNVQGFYTLTTSSELNPKGPFKAELGMLGGIGGNDIYTVNLNLDQYLVGPDAKLVANFYTYVGVLEATNSNILGYTFNTPRRVTGNINITHPQGNCISIVEVVLTDNAGTPISVIARFVVTRTVLLTRISILDLKWALGYSKPPIFLEIVDIDAKWPYAPA